MNSPHHSTRWLALAAALFLSHAGSAQTTSLTVANPNWNITLTDYGYSDFLLDNTPGFEGREYLSGEWGAAVSYSVGGLPVGPTWLEPHFLFPDWPTNSTFSVVSPITQIGLNADGLPIAESVIGNGQLQITLRFEMIDTVTGTPMGTTATSSGGAGASLDSNRYVMKQTATIKNISGAGVTGLQFHQLLHGLSSQRGVFDNRSHGGALAEFHHDTILSGVDPWSAGVNTSSSGLEDYIGFHAINAPSAHEIGHYGIEGNGVDDHGMGKPSDGVHLSIEHNWLDAPYDARLNRDSFEPSHRWLAGAQRWDLGNLAANQSTSIDIILSILTGTTVATGTGSSGGCNGGSGVPGGMDYAFESVDSPGSCFTSFARADDAEIEIRVARGEFDHFTFSTPGKPAQVWEVEFSGGFSGAADLTFCYDDTLLPPGFAESSLVIYHFSGGVWQKLNGAVNTLANTVSVGTTTMGAFALGVDGTLPTFTIAAGAAPAAGGSVTGGGGYPAGAGISLVATASSGYAFVGWTEGGGAAGESPALAFSVTGNRALVANFVLIGTGKSVTTLSLPVNGGSTTGGGVYPAGATANVQAVAEPGYKFSKWLVDGVVVSTAADYSFTVDGDTTLTAKFKPVYTINVTDNPPFGGEHEVDAAYESGELAKLKAVPADGYSFVNWTQNGVVVSTDPNFSFNVTGNRELVANFGAGHRIDAAAEPKNAGNVLGAGLYPDGSSVTLTAETKPGYVFIGWTEAIGQDVLHAGTTPEISFAAGSSRVMQANFIALPKILPDADPAGGGAVFRWPAGATTWILQESTDMIHWTTSTRPVITVDGQNQITVPPVGGGFFRLVHP